MIVLRGFFLVIAALVALEGVARADEPTIGKILQEGRDPDGAKDKARKDPRASAEARAVARQFLRANRFAEAKVEVDRAVLLADTAAERAAVSELAFVLEEWAMRGPPKRRTGCVVPKAPSWQRGVSDARAALIDGCFAGAEEAFEELFATSPDLVAAARVLELRYIARESEAEAVLPKKRDTPVTSPPTMTPDTTSDDAKPAVVNRWYGWQTLIMDGVALGLTPINPFVGLGFYLVGAPIVHAAHGRFVVGLGDLGLRFAAPVVGAAVPYIAATAGKNGRCNDTCSLATVAGAILGIGTAVAIDAAAIAREEVKPPPSATVRPLAVPHAHGIDFGLVGTF